MYTKEQEETALREYERLGSIAAVIHQLGYPSESTLYRWYERKKAGLKNRHGQIAETPTTMDHHCNTPEHPQGIQGCGQNLGLIMQRSQDDVILNRAQPPEIA